MSFAFHHQRAAMSTNIGETAKLGVIVGCNHERLVQASFKQGKRQHVAGGFDLLRIGSVLPARGENPVLLECEIARIGVDFRWEGRRGADIGIDIHKGEGSSAHRPEITLLRRNFQYADAY